MSAAARRRVERGFLPAGATTLFKRLAWQAAGLTALAFGFALAVALVTYSPEDASLNTAGQPGQPFHNMLGAPGAFGADLLLQLFGLACWLTVLTILAWGGRMTVSGRPAARSWLRALLLLCGQALLAIALAALPVPAFLAPPALFGATTAGFGGTAGRLLLDGFDALGGLVHFKHIAWAFALLCALFAVVCIFFAVGMSFGEWTRLWHALFGRPEETEETEKRDEAPSPARGRREPVFSGGRGADATEAEPVDGATLPRGEPLVAPRAPKSVPGKREREARQGRLDLADAAPDRYMRPPLSLLAPAPESRGTQVSEDSLAQNARLLESVLDDFGVNGSIVKVRPGPVVTLYELEPAPGTKTSRVIGLADDIARSMSALSVRIATVPGRSVIGIELPNHRRETVFLRELLAGDAFDRSPARLTLMLGKDIGGQPVMVDLARMPHLLIAGTTGSGKSVAINTMILSLLYRLQPEECRLIMIDPKMLELSVYDGIPHLLSPVVTEPGKAVVALKWAVREMEDRYRAMSQLGVRNIAGYNQRLAEAKTKGEKLSRTVQTGFDPDSGKPIYEDQPLALEPLPYIVIVVDEMADLMLVAGKDIEAAVQRLAQMARAAGIHLIMATQRPSVDVITGTIKANFPSRISFQVSSKIDSRTILGEQGAEQLLGQGDMLYMAAGGRITRVHGPFVSDQEVESVADHLREQGEPHYVEAVTEDDDEASGPAAVGGESEGGELYDQAVALVAREGKASTSFIQRHLQIGYNRAARIMEQMEKEGVVSRANHVGKREVLISHHGD
jgi:S-DNA-T family DNA segregation ATPase FtsK/SpoIIIE